MAIPRIQLASTALLVVDLQEKLLPHMHNHAQVLTQSAKLIQGCRLLGVPILVTEHYPKGLGKTVPAIEEALLTNFSAESAAVLRCDKMLFSALVEPVKQFLSEHRIRSVIVCGLEAHVCVMQTCLDLVDCGYIVATAMDAIGSRKELDHHTAVQRMIQIGVVPMTIEAALFEMVVQAGTPKFKAILPVVK